jgi:hypothetical protein
MPICLELVARVRDARLDWLEIERLADELLDDDLDSDVDMTRVGILCTQDRLDQLIVAGGEPELEAVL